MNRIQAKQLLPIIQAYAEGKTIQVKIQGDSKGTEEWQDVINLDFDIIPSCYRIKPEPKYRPFENAEECWAEMQKHQPFGWVKAYHGQFVITVIRDSKATIGRNDNFMDYDYILENYTFADGTPFGVKE